MAPPTIGPSTGPVEPTIPITPITRPMRAGPAARASRVSIRGSRIPAPKPCTTRKRMRVPMFQARPEAIDPAMNSTRPNSHNRLPPTRSTAHAVTGMVTVSASR